MGKIYQQVDITCVASVITTALVFTSTTEVPRTLKKVWTVLKTANYDLIIYDEREMICDIPLDSLPVNTPFIVFDRKIKVGHTVRVGFREGAGATPSSSISVESEIPD